MLPVRTIPRGASLPNTISSGGRAGRSLKLPRIRWSSGTACTQRTHNAMKAPARSATVICSKMLSSLGRPLLENPPSPCLSVATTLTTSMPTPRVRPWALFLSQKISAIAGRDRRLPSYRTIKPLTRDQDLSQSPLGAQPRTSTCGRPCWSGWQRPRPRVD